MNLASALLVLVVRSGAEPAAPDTSSPTATGPSPAQAAAPGPSALDNATCLQDTPTCVAVAGAHFDAGRFADAVRLFEALAAAHPEAPKYHYFAGLAREAAGDDTAAYVHMRRFLASDADHPTERKRATRRTVAILARTIKVDLRTPAHKDPLTLRLTRTGATHTGEPPILVPLAALTRSDGPHVLALTPGAWELALDPARFGENEVRPQRIDVPAAAQTLKISLTPVPIRHELTLDLGPARALHRGITLELRSSTGASLTFTAESPLVRRELPPGTWTYEASARGFLPRKHTLELDGPVALDVKLASKWTEDRRKRLKLGLGLTGASLATGIVGTALLGFSEDRMPQRTPNPDYDQIRRLRTLGDAGAAFIGAALGESAVALTGAITKDPSRTWKATLALGALAAAGSALSYGLINHRWATMKDAETLDAVGQRHAPILAAGGLGLGLGLIGGAVATLAQNRQPRARRAAMRRIHARLSHH